MYSKINFRTHFLICNVLSTVLLVTVLDGVFRIWYRLGVLSLCNNIPDCCHCSGFSSFMQKRKVSSKISFHSSSKLVLMINECIQTCLNIMARVTIQSKCGFDKSARESCRWNLHNEILDNRPMLKNV